MRSSVVKRIKNDPSRHDPMMIFWHAYVRELSEAHNTETDTWENLPDWERDGMIAGVSAVVEFMNSKEVA